MGKYAHLSLIYQEAIYIAYLNIHIATLVFCNANVHNKYSHLCNGTCHTCLYHQTDQ